MKAKEIGLSRKYPNLCWQSTCAMTGRAAASNLRTAPDEVFLVLPAIRRNWTQVECQWNRAGTWPLDVALELKAMLAVESTLISLAGHFIQNMGKLTWCRSAAVAKPMKTYGRRGVRSGQ